MPIKQLVGESVFRMGGLLLMAGRKAGQRPENFSLAEARAVVQDLFRPRPWVYWADFALSYSVGLFFFRQVRGGGLDAVHQGWTGNPSQVLYFVVSALCFYRCSLFIHELVHQRNNELVLFRWVWNLLCGISFLIPSFVYYPHIDHHRRQHFGTARDGEYLPLSRQRRWRTLYYLSWSLVIPAVAVFRFMILTPLAWCSPVFRRWLHEHLSSMVMDPTYIRPLPTAAVLRTIRWQELGCFLWCWGVALVPPLWLGRWPIPFVVHAYLTGVFIIGLNAIRTLGSHRWINDGREMTFLQQLLDSVNYPHRPWFTEIWGPVGTRYHALHHLFPGLPYHAMPASHRRLMAHLPDDSPYRQTEEVSLWSACRKLWQRSRQSSESVDPNWSRSEAA